MGEFVYFTEEQKQRANAVDLEDFLSRQGEKLLRSGREKRLASDHSITVRGNRWYDHATEKGGCAIDFADEIGTIPKIESMEMMFSAGRSRRISMVPIIQSFAQLEKNYGKEGSSIIIDNCQDILFGGFAPNSESAEILSKALGNRTVLSGSISKGKNDPSQSLQMMSRPLMAPEELKTLPKGNFILAKTGVCPMKTRLPLFLKWGIRFEEVYEVPEQAAREVVYADRLELEEEIVRRSDFDEEDLWRGSVESGKLEEASFLGGKAHGETAKEKQHKAATRRPPLRTD